MKLWQKLLILGAWNALLITLIIIATVHYGPDLIERMCNA